jgi:protease-4
MGKFLLGVLTGVLLLVVLVGVAVYVAVSFRSKPPSIAAGSTLILRLSGDLPEKSPVELPLPFLEQRSATTVEEVWSLLRRAAADSRIAAVVFEPQDSSLGWAKMEEIKADLEQFRKSGKPLIAYLKSPGSRDYYLASACAKVYMAPTDMLDLKGVALETMYFRNTLEKLGVKVDVEHAGKYKDYGDMFVRTSMSPETQEVMTGLVDGIFDDLVNTIAKGRGKDAAAVRTIIDNGPFLSGEAKASGLVDDLLYEDQMFGLLKTQLKQTELKKVSSRDYVGVPDSDAGLEPKSRIAFVVGEGSITRGRADSDLDSGLESEAFDRMLDRVARDKDLKGVIVRIDSPGGEVTASDEMWRAMNELRKKKPVVISMSDYGASGGYFMAMSGDPIIAYPATLTGSIGVVFGKPNLHGLYDKLGITKDSVSRGRFALIESDYASLSPAESDKLRHGIDVNYEDFLAKVAAARRKPVAEIAAIAQGRVWLGSQAKANGLVDELGGLDRAVDMIKAKSGIPAGETVSLVVFPARRSLLDYAMGSKGDSDAAEAAVPMALKAAGLEPLRAAWHDAGMRVWMRGGMLRMMPFTIQFH